MRNGKSYPRILGRYVREQKVLSLEKEVEKMTGMPAKRVGLKDCGVLREGMFANITIFNPQTVITRATFEASNQYPEGIPYVIVNGQLSVDKGKRTAALAGRPLRGPGYQP